MKKIVHWVEEYFIWMFFNIFFFNLCSWRTDLQKKKKREWEENYNLISSFVLKEKRWRKKIFFETTRWSFFFFLYFSIIMKFKLSLKFDLNNKKKREIKNIIIGQLNQVLNIKSCKIFVFYLAKTKNYKKMKTKNWICFISNLMWKVAYDWDNEIIDFMSNKINQCKKNEWK